jgi:hypothetical protein
VQPGQCEISDDDSHLVVNSDSLVPLSNSCVVPEYSHPSDLFLTYELNHHDWPELGLPTGSYATEALCQPVSPIQPNHDPQPSIPNEDIFRANSNSTSEFASVFTGYIDPDPAEYIWKSSFEASFYVAYPETHSSSFNTAGERDSLLEPVETTITMDVATLSPSVATFEIEPSSSDPATSWVSPDTLQSGPETSQLKRSRSSSSPPFQSGWESKRIRYSTDQPCLWVGCSEVFENVSHLRLVLLTHKRPPRAYIYV